MTLEEAQKMGLNSEKDERLDTGMTQQHEPNLQSHAKILLAQSPSQATVDEMIEEDNNSKLS
jgi:hypothetical protein